MATDVLDVPSPVVRSRRATVVLLSLTALVALVFVAAAALPYFLSSSYGPPEYAPRRGWLLLHIVGGMSLVIRLSRSCAPTALTPRIDDRNALSIWMFSTTLFLARRMASPS